MLLRRGLRLANCVPKYSFKRSYTPLNYDSLKNYRRHAQAPQPHQFDATRWDQQPVTNEQGVILPSDSIANILRQPTLVIERQMEMMNIFLGFEQANRYVIMDPTGSILGYMLERDLGITKAILRQIYRLHRPFTVDVMDTAGNVLMTIKRPFSFINSHIKAILPPFRNSDPDEHVIGESVQSWHPWRRRYNLFTAQIGEKDTVYDQFGYIDAPFLSFEFPVLSESRQTLGAVSRNFVGFARELFTDTGVYIIRMGPESFVGLEGNYGNNVAQHALTLDQRAVLLANAVSIDFDYFSRHSSHSGGFIGFEE
ncbi:hypothetical protein PP7435_CHR4-0168 [Komagataella phaffii CBS 7435]|uniref:Phospholipid scramblase n=2 Tax=Komagataella phaffii TaxID=460519 RepID=C4R8X8_KOMPG|nr:uncharacterized protein PAS_chr4_0787 [Komagataella phaffii GS115]AOA65078.1 GQ67_05175T0 [Komagataella phaffii]CAH2450539.1 hypothetical protein BQ9382_C4-0900 [Komagataella phaffii CBS 7435]AOA70190.1 GQ68_05157T0 [Komagataella phaffii GS115]CAY72053.1 Putative protein of unknown function [Komagataella phaffii GS115]CCA40343.1 hypothetical protein PP7435_CHR4-0168 [Komagataella phaffii CBS 7435]